MRDKPHNGTLARPDPRSDPFQWSSSAAGVRATSGERQSREHSQFRDERDTTRRLSQRPKTSIGAAREDILFYSDRYRRRGSVTKSGYGSLTTSATPVSPSAQATTHEQARAQHHQQEVQQEDSSDERPSCNVVVERVDSFLTDEGAKRSPAARSSRPRTSQRRISDYKAHSSGDAGVVDEGAALNVARLQQRQLRERASEDVARDEACGRERRTSSSGSALSDPFRRRSYVSGVTFDVPRDAEVKGFTSAPQQQLPPPSCRSNKFRALRSRRMSAPELPPIVDNKGRPPGVNSRADKRSSLTSSTGNRASVVHQTPILKNKTFPSRLTTAEHIVSEEATRADKAGQKKKDLLPRNFSEPTLSGLLGNASTLSQESGSTSRSFSTHNADAASGSGSKQQMKFLSAANRALSWCATDNNVGSQGKLETLFEGKVQHHGPEGDAGPGSGPKSPQQPAQPFMPYVNSKASSTSSVNNVISMVSSANNVSYDANNNSSSNNNDVIAGQTRSRKDASRLQSLNPSETPRGRFHRSSSENKHNGKSQKHEFGQRQERTSLQTMSRNQSVDRIDKLASWQRTHSKPAAESKPGTYRLRRASSNIVLSNNINNNNNREDEIEYDNYYPEDDRDLLNKARIEQWLNVVNSVDQYDTDPKDIDFDYMDEIPQTDTAIHVVHEGD